MDFSKLIVSNENKKKKDPNKLSIKDTYKVQYYEGDFFVELKSGLVKVCLDHSILTKVNHIYSRPENDKQMPWRIKETSGKSKTTSVAFLWWSPIKDKQRIKGELGDHGFEIDIDYINIVNKVNWERYVKNNK